jgi:hypothetical protein
LLGPKPKIPSVPNPNPIMPKQDTLRGRPRLLDPIKKAEICALVYAGRSQRHAAVYVGVARSTITAEMHRDPDFDRAYKGAVRKREHDLVAEIRATSEKSRRAAAWLLEKTVAANCRRQPAKQLPPPPSNHVPQTTSPLPPMNPALSPTNPRATTALPQRCNERSSDPIFYERAAMQEST